MRCVSVAVLMLTLAATLLLGACTVAKSQRDGQQSLDGATLFIACAGCHSLAPDAPHGVGPNLYALDGRRAGSSEGFAYSPALQDSAIIWSRDSLRAWIMTSETMAPGTWMLYHNPLQADEVARLVDYIMAEA